MKLTKGQKEVLEKLQDGKWHQGSKYHETQSKLFIEEG